MGNAVQFAFLGELTLRAPKECNTQILLYFSKCGIVPKQKKSEYPKVFNRGRVSKNAYTSGNVGN